MPRRFSIAISCLILLAAAGRDAAIAATVWLDELDLSAMTAGWGAAKKNQSITETPLRIAGQAFAHGVGTHAVSDYYLALDGRAKTFSAKVGVDDNARSDGASLEFIVSGDGRVLWRSGVCKFRQPARECRVDLANVKMLRLQVTDADDGVHFDHADWADAAIAFDGAAPRPTEAPQEVVPKEEAVALTPAAPAEPRINGPKLYGLRPGSPLIYRIPCTGQRPITFAAEGLPEGIVLDAKTGILTGRTTQAGTYRITLTARNDRGQTQRPGRLVVGNQLALTPPMGWNSWYIHYNRVTDADLRKAADQMLDTGMADYGYQYVNIDDCWMDARASGRHVADPKRVGPGRDAQGNIQPNGYFPDMKAMTDYIHAKGLKAGIYTSPGPRTCAGFEGSYQHEEADARQFAAWGFDFLKYDWCSYGGVAGGKSLEHLQKPYRIMWANLQKLDRDVVFNLCQYGMGDVWKWGGEVGHCWRTTGDLGLERGSGLPGFFSIGMKNATHWEYAKSGAWNDPDYILIGWVGDAHKLGRGRPTTLTPSEQYAYMSMWSLMAAPLIFSGDMAKLDAFTLNILCNHEVIDVNQDPLGRQARVVRKTTGEFVLLKDLEDGSKALGVFNLAPAPAKLSVAWSDLGLSGRQRVRDLWRQKDLGVHETAFEAEVPRHGVVMVRLGKAE